MEGCSELDISAHSLLSVDAVITCFPLQEDGYFKIPNQISTVFVFLWRFYCFLYFEHWKVKKKQLGGNQIYLIVLYPLLLLRMIYSYSFTSVHETIGICTGAPREPVQFAQPS